MNEKLFCSVDTSFYNNLSHHCVCLYNKTWSIMHVSLFCTGYTHDSSLGELRGMIIAHSLYGNIPVYICDNTVAVSYFKRIFRYDNSDAKQRNRTYLGIKICDSLSKRHNHFCKNQMFIVRLKQKWLVIIFESSDRILILSYSSKMNISDVEKMVDCYSTFEKFIVTKKQNVERFPNFVRSIIDMTRFV